MMNNIEYGKERLKDIIEKELTEDSIVLIATDNERALKEVKEAL